MSKLTVSLTKINLVAVFSLLNFEYDYLSKITFLFLPLVYALFILYHSGGQPE